MRRAYADVPAGQIHYVEEGEGKPVLLLHQSPRSWTEFREVLPLLGRTHRAIAMDTLGYGASSAPLPPAGGPPGESVEAYADGVVQLFDALGIERAALVGHHTGGVIAVEVAAVHPDRVEKIVLSCTPLVDAEGRTQRPRVDHAEVHEDGDHLLELWRARQPYYPPGRPDLLEAFIVDALTAGTRRHEGHAAVARYAMETRLPRLRCPVMAVGAPGDVAYRDLPRWAAAVPGIRIEEIKGGMVPLPDHLPEEFTDVVRDFLDAA
ncbi:Pimeloyl-ACP methyl ester carboxylesterase [Actinacidiphila paucisporea]|uniref:Pimeloyl-ACP methyl ester carboxylesterase n=2 Tax=Actinacidiphila paucisporea TaxID=310782 RepID=A0A1M7G5Q8_9ACTN|nr:Pimeloyl-ACP methyl ester carboxylesterase [Actinacidiphila paucisporea]